VERHILVVRTRAKEGRDGEYNEWYDGVHLSEVLTVKGFASAQRFTLSEIMMADPQEQELPYLAIYELETDDISATLDALRAALPGMTISGALDGAMSVVAFKAHDAVGAL
jgi:hypothetical protein